MAKEDPKGRARSRLIEDAQELETSLDALLDEQPVAPGLAGTAVNAQPPRFERLRVLGVGATATVYEAWDCRLERHVALKVAVGERVRGTALRMERFGHEVRVTARLDHPAIVPIFDAADLEDPQAWFAMRRVRGLTLAQAIVHHHSGDASWGLARLVDAIRRAAEGIAYAHGEGVIHRDLKPANILLGQFGEVLVVDWGLSRELDEPDPFDLRPDETALTPDATTLTSVDGEIIGTPAYIAPEMATGSKHQCSPATDVYALGCTLYALLTGEAPYVDGDPERPALALLSHLRTGPPTPPDRLAPQAPAELVSICQRAMQRNPADRFQSAQEFSQELTAYLEGRVVPSHRVGKWEAIRKWMRREPVAALLVGLMLMALVAFVSVQLRSATRLHQLVAQRTDQAYAGTLLAASAAVEARDYPEVRRHLESAASLPLGWEWEHLAHLVDNSVAQLKGHRAALRELLVDAQGSRLFSLDVSGRCILWSLPQLVETRRVELGGGLDSAALTPDGSRLLIGRRDGRFEVWRAETFELLSATQAEAHSLIDIAFEIAGPRLVVTYASRPANIPEQETRDSRHALGRGHQVWTLDGDRLTPLGPLRDFEDYSLAAAFLPGSHRVLVGTAQPEYLAGETRTREYRVALWDPMDKGPPRPIATKRERSLALLPARDGSWYINLGWTGLLQRFLVDRPDPLWTAELTLGPRSRRTAFQAALSPDESLIVCGGQGTEVRIHDAATGALLHVLSGQRDSISAVAFLSGGERVIAGALDGQIRIWNTRPSPARQSLALPFWAFGAAFSPAEDRLATSCRDGTVSLWSLPDGVRQVTFKGLAPDWGQAPNTRASRTPWPVLFARGGEVLFSAENSHWEALDPQNDRVYARALSPDSDLWVSEPLGGNVHHLFHQDSTGTLLVGLSTGMLRILDADSGRILRSFNTPGRRAETSPTGELYALIASDGTIELRATLDGQLFRTLAGHRQPTRQLAWSRDGQFLATAADNGDFSPAVELFVWEVQSAAPIKRLSGPATPIHSLAWSPDGQRLATAEQGGTLRLWDTQAGTCVLIQRYPEEVLHRVTWSPSGETLALSAATDSNPQNLPDNPAGLGIVHLWRTR